MVPVPLGGQHGVDVAVAHALVAQGGPHLGVLRLRRGGGRPALRGVHHARLAVRPHVAVVRLVRLALRRHGPGRGIQPVVGGHTRGCDGAHAQRHAIRVRGWLGLLGLCGLLCHVSCLSSCPSGHSTRGSGQGSPLRTWHT